MHRTTSILARAILVIITVILFGCGKDKSKMTDAELGLNPQQSRGRAVYNTYCLVCHPAYSSRGDKGPGLKGLYSRPYLPSGLTANDEHVTQSIIQGRGMMPRTELTQEQVQDLIAYMHTL
ncbi:MAG TPA: cytochrome c [Candidatus Angelobacter sp.]|nr:cytochrome c [Candidatus Angelobacter sp.]